MKNRIDNQYKYIVSALRYDKDCVEFEIDEMIRVLNHYIDMDLVDSYYTKYQLQTLKHMFEVFRDGYKLQFYSMDNLKRIDTLMDIDYKDSICSAIGTTKDQYNDLNGYLDSIELYMV